MTIRRLLPLSLISLLIAACGAGNNPPPTPTLAVGQSANWTFDTDPAAAPPTGATVFSGTWQVQAEADAPSGPNVVCQIGEADFPALQLINATYSNVSISTRFKPVTGSQDQAAGIIFHIQDAENYMVVRVNALERNLTMYTYVGGVRSPIAEASAQVEKATWQELRVELAGSHIAAYLNGELVIETDNTTYKSGAIGLWTKADSVTCFDDVVVTVE